MIYGPFSLAGTSAAEFRMMYWINSEQSYDVLFLGASTDGSNFYGASTSGVYDWTERVFDLADVYTLGDLTGQPQVWVLVAFQSDLSMHAAEGVYVDDVLLRKFVGETPTTTPAPTSTVALPATFTPTPTGTPVAGPTATATATSTPTPTSTATSVQPPTATLTPAWEEARFYLPWAINHFPFIPAAPFLDAISNADGDGSYTISWSSSEGADTYTVQEDDNEDFSSPISVYSGSSTSTAINGRDVGTYFYRAKASNAHDSSDWSNVETLEVTVPLPDCPQTGEWSGTTDQGRNISFVVENSPQCQIAANSLQITIRDSCYYVTTTQFARSYSITNNSFDTGGVSSRVKGDFTSLTTIDGTFSLSMANPFPPPYNCTASGTWEATPR